jgi:chemotaxis protein MotB
MADKAPIIIRRKKIVAGHGHHGGAWKVAYADFVTAMMAFFLVMWLMGSDEETKAAIAHYFNHPQTPFNDGGDPDSKAVHPMGELQGQGDSILSGLGGANPEDLVPRPSRSLEQLNKFKQIHELLTSILDGNAAGFDIQPDYLKFSVPESMFFSTGSSQFKPGSGEYIRRIGSILEEFEGDLQITDYTEERYLDGTDMGSSYEASVIRAVAVMDRLVETKKFPADRIRTSGTGLPAPQAKRGTKAPVCEKNCRVEFTLRGQKNE